MGHYEITKNTFSRPVVSSVYVEELGFAYFVVLFSPGPPPPLCLPPAPMAGLGWELPAAPRRRQVGTASPRREGEGERGSFCGSSADLSH